QRNGADNQADINRDKADISRDRADIQSDRRDVAKDRADIRSDQQDLRADTRDVRSDRRELHGDREMVGSGGNVPASQRDLRTARNSNDTASQRMLGERTQTTTAMETRDAHGANARTASATHATGAQPLTPGAMASNTVSENNKKQASQDSAHKP